MHHVMPYVHRVMSPTFRFSQMAHPRSMRTSRTSIAHINLVILLLPVKAAQASLLSRADRAAGSPFCAAMAERSSYPYERRRPWDDDDGDGENYSNENWWPKTEWNFESDNYHQGERSESYHDQTSADRDRDITRPWTGRSDYPARGDTGRAWGADATEPTMDLTRPEWKVLEDFRMTRALELAEKRADHHRQIL